MPPKPPTPPTLAPVAIPSSAPEVSVSDATCASLTLELADCKARLSSVQAMYALAQDDAADLRAKYMSARLYIEQLEAKVSERASSARKAITAIEGGTFRYSPGDVISEEHVKQLQRGVHYE